MQELIPINESSRNGEVVLTVDARLLHEKLGVGRDFSTWINNRISQYNFTENVDYWVFAKSGENQNACAQVLDNTFPQMGERDSLGTSGFRTRIDYALSLNMAKELSMVENNDIGRQFRLYFIEVDDKYRASIAPESDEAIILRAHTILQRRVEQLKATVKAQAEQIEEAKPAVTFYKAVTPAEGDIEVGEMAIMLSNAGYKTTRNKLFEELREMGLLIKQSGHRWNMPTQKAVDKGYLKEVEQLMSNSKGIPTLFSNGKQLLVQKSVITPVGQKYFIDYFTKKREKSLLDNLVPNKLSILEH
jgi:anti-repressor protein